MLVQRIRSEEKVIVSYTITGITNADMRKMTSVYGRVLSIISNHLNKSAEKREYLSDDDLYDILSILDVLTDGNSIITETSVFEERKAELIKMYKEVLDPPYAPAHSTKVEQPF